MAAPGSGHTIWRDFALPHASRQPRTLVLVGIYIVGRTSGHMEIKLKALSQVAGGAKGLRYYTFGPEYNFPATAIQVSRALLVACWREWPARTR